MVNVSICLYHEDSGSLYDLFSYPDHLCQVSTSKIHLAEVVWVREHLWPSLTSRSYLLINHVAFGLVITVHKTKFFPSTRIHPLVKRTTKRTMKWTTMFLSSLGKRIGKRTGKRTSKRTSWTGLMCSNNPHSPGHELARGETEGYLDLSSH